MTETVPECLKTNCLRAKWAVRRDDFGDLAIWGKVWRTGRAGRAQRLKEDSMSRKELVPVFMPPLANVLAWAEKKKGSPLPLAEVEEIRDESPCIMMESADARRM